MTKSMPVAKNALNHATVEVLMPIDNIAPNESVPRRQTTSDAERNDTNPQAHNITDTCYSLTLSQTTVTLGVSLGN